MHCLFDKIAVLMSQRLPRLGDPGFDKETWLNGIGELGSGILHPSMWQTPIPELSDGNKRRAQLAVAVVSKPEILLIDEPTNYLDLSAVEVLEEAFRNWSGTLIVASHARWLKTNWHGRQIHLKPAAECAN